MTDISADLQAQVMDAIAEQCPLYINGGGSKRQRMGRDCEARVLELGAHRGVVDYRSGELVVTARAGTTIAELQDLLARQGQGLSSEPPQFAGVATLGGTLACNLSGPARPFGGSLRDAVLGVQLINGRGELLNFGGQVMKNVAGYDVARLQAGALGTLGVITQLSLKVLPLPEQQLTLAYALSPEQAVDTMCARAREPYPLTGACWFGGQLYLRLAGAAAAVEQAASAWGGDPLSPGAEPWEDLREWQLPFFNGDGPLWRLSLAASSKALLDEPEQLIDWAGAQRWLRGERDFGQLQALAKSSGGHASLVAGGDRQGEVRQALEPAQQALQQRLKQAFDPAGLFNPGRLYSWM